MDLILRKIEKDLSRIAKKDFDIEIRTLDVIAGTFVPYDNIIDFQNSILYAFYFESATGTESILKSYEKYFTFYEESDCLIKFLTPITIDNNLTKMKYALIKLIR
jgi:hypothetical protein